MTYYSVKKNTVLIVVLAAFLACALFLTTLTAGSGMSAKAEQGPADGKHTAEITLVSKDKEDLKFIYLSGIIRHTLLIIYFLEPLRCNILEGIILILIDTLIAEAIDGVVRVVQLHTLHNLVVLVVERRVLVRQQRLIHLKNPALTVGEVGIDVHGELANLQEFVGIDVELPSRVAHLAVITVINSGITGI